uniref:hypothetical protein n=1 Tax=Cupriavidus taiwanensis TaxID=164546 RepID=UPI0011C07095|nr:hypothetical protein [Cupriavidus taiwanensis]
MFWILPAGDRGRYCPDSAGIAQAVPVNWRDLQKNHRVAAGIRRRVAMGMPGGGASHGKL